VPGLPATALRALGQGDGAVGNLSNDHLPGRCLQSGGEPRGEGGSLVGRNISNVVEVIAVTHSLLQCWDLPLGVVSGKM